MKIVIAPDSYKGCLSSIEVANFLEKGLLLANGTFNILKVPISDGGEGTVDTLIYATNGKRINTVIKGPLFNDINSYYGIIGNSKTAVIEMAKASGLELLSTKDKNPMNTTTYGVGQLILDALDKECKEFIIGIGGSATNDGGMGMSIALGIKFYDKNNKVLRGIGSDLIKIHKIDISHIDKRIKKCNIKVACDVINPLFGDKGASFTYAKQKGADNSEIKILDLGLKNLSNIMKRDYNITNEYIEGVGAAGGLGYGLLTFLNGKLEKGIDIILEVINFKDIIKDANLLITGEGQTDYQTVFNKAPVGLAKLASQYDVPTICISGTLSNNFEEVYNNNILAAFSIINNITTLDKAINQAPKNLISFGYSIGKVLSLGIK